MEFRKSRLSQAEPNEIRSAGSAQIVGRRLARAAICDDFVADLLTFTQRSKSGALNGADVHEDILAAIVRLDEAKAFLAVEPLYGSLRHENFFQVRV